MSTPRVPVRFTCHACGVGEQTVSVRGREPGESIASWMRTVGRAVQFTHGALSPRCQSRHVDLKIPAEGLPAAGTEKEAPP